MSQKTLTKADLVEAVAEATGKNRRDLKNVIDKLIQIMTDAMVQDHALLLSGFGKFECFHKRARRGRNPMTSESIMLAARTVVVFRVSRNFRKELNPEEAEEMGDEDLDQDLYVQS